MMRKRLERARLFSEQRKCMRRERHQEWRRGIDRKVLLWLGRTNIHIQMEMCVGDR